MYVYACTYECMLCMHACVCECVHTFWVLIMLKINRAKRSDDDAPPMATWQALREGRERE